MTELLITAAIFDPSAIVDYFLNADAFTVYWLVFALMVVESSFIPFPSEVIVPPAAYLATTSHEVSIWVILILATLGALTGALINYYLSLWIGRPIVYRFADSKIGHALLINREKVLCESSFCHVRLPSRISPKRCTRMWPSPSIFVNSPTFCAYAIG